VRYTKEQRQEHIQRWQESGLSRAAYCREHELPYQTFATWAKQPKAGLQAAAEGAFVQLTDDRPASPNGGATLRVRIGGLDLVFSAMSSPAWVAAVLERLARC